MGGTSAFLWKTFLVVHVFVFSGVEQFIKAESHEVRVLIIGL